MINTKQVVPALVAVTLLFSLAPAAEALAIEEHAQSRQTCRCGCG